MPSNSKEYDKQYREAHKEKYNAYAREYYKQHREEKIAYQKTYRAQKKNDPDYKEKIRARSLKRYHNPNTNLSLRLRHRIYMAITKKGYHKNKKVEEILGCSIDTFKEYITALFQPGMSWDNYGEWHLDHIKPLSLAQNEQEIYKLCHYTNYQPLWAQDNLQKGNKF